MKSKKIEKYLTQASNVVNSREAIPALTGARFTQFEINENPSYYTSCPGLVLELLNCPDLL
jgi:hypothetical protein